MKTAIMNHPKQKFLAVSVSVLFMAGCSTFSPDGGMDRVSSLTKERTGLSVARSSAENDQSKLKRIDELLAAPLSADTAVQIALLNNEGLQAAFSDLGVSEADYVQAGRMRNPGISFSHFRGGENLEINRSVMFDLLGLLTLPIRSGIEQRRFEQAKISAAASAVDLAANTRKAFFDAVAAQQSAKFMEQVQIAAEASADIAQRMAKVGNWSKLDRTREQVFYAEATAQVARSRQEAVASKEQLIRLLGLWGARADIKLPERLPDLPKAPNDMADLESEAMRQRLDIQIAKGNAEATAKGLGLTRATGLINVLDAGYANKSQTGLPRENGYQVSLELPIFDWGSARTAKAEALYMQSVHRTADIAVKARSEVREAYSGYRTKYDLAKHYRDEIVPLRRTISDEVLMRYNGMLTSVFELLADSREQIHSVNASIEAQRDFWIADTDLQSAISGTGSADSALTSQRMRGTSSQNKR